jgi:hypothetical protein
MQYSEAETREDEKGKGCPVVGPWCSKQLWEKFVKKKSVGGFLYHCVV